MPLIFYRIGNQLYKLKVPLVPKLFTVLGWVLSGAYIPSECKIGKNCKVAYGGSGLVVHPRAIIGNHCLLSPGVVIGGRGGHYPVPVIGDNVSIFPGAKILGPIRIGDGASIGANAVVVESVLPGEAVVAPKAHRLGRA